MTRRTIDPAGKLPNKDVIKLAGEWVYVGDQGAYWHLPSLEVGEILTLSPALFNAECQHLTGVETHAALVAWQGTQRVSTVVYEPGGPRFVEGRVAGRRALNQWSMGGVAAREDDEKLARVLAVAAHQIPNPDHRNLILDAWAYLLINRGGKVDWCPILRGRTGTGKGTLCEDILGNVFGRDNMKFPTGDALAEPYTAEIVETEVTVVNEVQQGNDRAVTTRLKSPITERFIMARRMWGPRYRARTAGQIIITTNERKPLYLPKGSPERRYLMTEFIEEQVDREIIRPIKRDVEGHAAAFRWYLEHRDISGFDPTDEPPCVLDDDDQAEGLTREAEALASALPDPSSDLLLLPDIRRACQDVLKKKVRDAELLQAIERRGWVVVGAVLARGAPKVVAVRDTAKYAGLNAKELMDHIEGTV